jgi:hypothetical protein
MHYSAPDELSVVMPRYDAQKSQFGLRVSGGMHFPNSLYLERVKLGSLEASLTRPFANSTMASSPRQVDGVHARRAVFVAKERRRRTLRGARATRTAM